MALLENDDPNLLALTTCTFCENAFAVPPHQVCLLVRDANGLPPDLGGDPATARECPVCPACVKIFNRKRREQGMPDGFPEFD